MDFIRRVATAVRTCHGRRTGAQLLMLWLLVSPMAISVPPLSANGAPPATGPALLGTTPLEWDGDIASRLVDGVDRFLLRQWEASIDRRIAHWPKPQPEQPASTADYEAAIAPLRSGYQNCIGLVDPRVTANDWIVESRLARDAETHGSAVSASAVTASVNGISILQVRWPVLDGFDARGLLLIPQQVRWSVILVPDAGQFPETLCGNGPDSNSIALDLARQGALVVIPQVVSRHREARMGRAIMTDQEYVYRSAFVLGRHLLGYHVQQCMAAVDILKASDPERPIAVVGWGEGGWITLAAAACDPRIDAALVSGHFAPRENLWQEPIHRNVHGLLEHFGDAQLAALIAPRTLILDCNAGPRVDIPGEGGAPGILSGPTFDETKREWVQAQSMLAPWHLESSVRLENIDQPATIGRASPRALECLMESLSLPRTNHAIGNPSQGIATPWPTLPSSELRRIDLLNDLDRFQQRVLDVVHRERDAHWQSLDTSSLERFQETVEPFRQEFRERIIGHWEEPKLDPNPRARQVYDTERWTGYEVVLDVFDDVIAYGVLLVPKSDTPIRNRPCVVFQHGLEGRPSDTIVGDHPAYHDVSSRLANEGYVVFAPQNLYLFTDRFRTLQRKSNPLGKTLFSTIIAQHEQIVGWLGSRPEIDPTRIAFYGLSYGGKSAMRIPALVPEYCMSICSADFNDWVWKNASTSSPYSYVWTMEYEIFEFDLGRTFNYAEMAALIAPRPFMVERGHFDGVAPDERVGLEYAKVRHLYAARLKIPAKTRIEWFDGPHTVHGIGTFEFLRQHLKPD